MSRHVSLIKNTAILAFGKFTTQFLTILLLPIYTRYLSPSEYGTFDLIMTYIGLALPFLTLRIEYAVFRFLVDARLNDSEKTRIISTAFRIVVGILAGWTLLYLLVQNLVDIPYAILILGLALASTISGVMLQISRGIGSNRGFAIASMIAGITTSLGSIVAIVGLKMGIEGIFLAAIIGNVLAAIYLWFDLKIAKHIKPKAYEKKMAKELTSFAIPMVPSGLAWWTINGLDRTLIVIFLGLSANGIYAIASRYAFVLVSISGVFGMAWKESASMHINAKDRDRYFSQTINTAIKFFGALGLLLIAMTPILFDTVFGEAYREAMLYIPLLVLGAFFNMLVEMFAGVYVAKKMSGKLAVTNIIAAVISIVLNLILIQFIGLYAVAISMAVAFGSMALWRSYDMKKYVSIKYDKIGLTKLFLGAVVVVSLYYFAGLAGSVIATLVTFLLTLHFAQPIIPILKQRFLRRKQSIK